ncbi:MAG: hypothetical protein HC837_08500 [Chloroflexaceae bacterium]|nr:hypothetical protein [Chloroflexaceae bacterium]
MMSVITSFRFRSNHIWLLLVIGWLSACAPGQPSNNVTPSLAPTTTDHASPEGTPMTVTESPDNVSEAIVSDAGGFSVTPIADWYVLHEDIDRQGVVVMSPTPLSDTDAGPTALISLSAGPLTAFYPEATADSDLDSLLKSTFPPSQTVEVMQWQDITIDGVPGRSVELTDEESSNVHIRVTMFVVRTGTDHLFQVVAVAPENMWEQMPIETLLDSIHLFEPGAGATATPYPIGPPVGE